MLDGSPKQQEVVNRPTFHVRLHQALPLLTRESGSV